jgi:hypothetical protein
LRNAAVNVGLISPEVYSTAWVALVPSIDDINQPAWPQALEFIRTSQLADGGWGEPNVYFAHERLISTLAAILALATWKNPADESFVERGVAAVSQYVAELASEPNEPIGFELLLPALLSMLEPFSLKLPPTLWSDEFKRMTAKKKSLIGNLEVDYQQPRTWWFSMEILPEERLLEIDERILDRYGSIATSTATTAAYLRALRLNGRNSPRAAAFLNHVLNLGNGGVSFCWPIEVFELTWVLDSFRRAGFASTDRELAPLIKALTRMYETSPTGLSWSQAFPLNDCDNTATGYAVLRWAGLEPCEKPLLGFWETNHFLTYLDERTPSVSANVHALTALRYNLTSSEHKRLAIRVTEWLREQLRLYKQFNDKWHVSPLYVTSRSISALAGWDNDLAQQCIHYILECQDVSGGWGRDGRPNIEETSLAVLGLIAGLRAGLLKDEHSLKLASRFLGKHHAHHPSERLWIGKTLYQPVGVTLGTVYAAQASLSKQQAYGWAQSYSYSMSKMAPTQISQLKQHFSI